MPSIVLGSDPASGAVPILSGFNPWSGNLDTPQGGLLLRWISSGGNCYIALSGGNPIKSGGFMTITSGSMYLSGGANSGQLDGMIMLTGDKLYIPAGLLISRTGYGSGQFNVFALCDAAASGVGRLYFDRDMRAF